MTLGFKFIVLNLFVTFSQSHIFYLVSLLFLTSKWFPLSHQSIFYKLMFTFFFFYFVRLKLCLYKNHLCWTLYITIFISVFLSQIKSCVLHEKHTHTPFFWSCLRHALLCSSCVIQDQTKVSKIKFPNHTFDKGHT